MRWDGSHTGVHEPLVTRERFAEVPAVLTCKPRAFYPKQKHPFMGLLTCDRCGCAMTAERKKAKYTYCWCTNYRGSCGNTYVREEALVDLLSAIVDGFRFPWTSPTQSPRTPPRPDRDAEGAARSGRRAHSVPPWRPKQARPAASLYVLGVKV